jgi:hypothetical protein
MGLSLSAWDTSHLLHYPRGPEMGDNAGLEFRNVQKSILAENQEASPRWTQTPHPESPLVEKGHVCNKTSVAMPKARSTDDPAVGL